MSRQGKLQEDTSFRVMRILEENPDLTQRELAEQFGMSPSAGNERNSKKGRVELLHEGLD